MNPYSRAPHAGPDQHPAASNAALLIDFDNVTMGMRSDLAKELKNLLDSDVIKGKVTVQRAYADWRRYPQYIVPLSEASIDLIFAPAYGSSKKNATDIRMAIDGMELVFIRPEIGTYILLTGDSDFSSLVLKLKEYGKYVIGIGIQESSSDILVQNCHEYYSYTSVTGLSKTSEGGRRQDGLDPWQVAGEAVARMVARGDAMRSDRLKQVMMEISPGFDERNLGYGKFSKFVAEAAKKGLLHIERRENGQYEVAPPKREGGGRPAAVPAAGKGPAAGRSSAAGKGSAPGKVAAAGKTSPAEKSAASGTSAAEKAAAPGKNSAAGAPNGQGPRRKDRKGAARESAPVADEGKAADASVVAETEAGKDRSAALQLLQRALREFGEKAEQGVRDSDVKRKLIALDADFDEGRLGFGKFSKFLLFAETHGVVGARRLEGGSFEVRVPPPAELDAKALGLPTSVESIKSYLTNRYKGIGAKTAEKLIASFGTKVFDVLQDEPERVRDVLPKARAVRVLAAWEDDHQRRSKLSGGRDRGSARGADSPAGSGRSDAKPTSRDAPAPTDRNSGPRADRKPGPLTERKAELPTDRKPGRPTDREPALAAKPGARTVHEPRVRHFGRGRTGAKADSGRSGAGSLEERRPGSHAAAAKADSSRSGIGAARSNVDSRADAADAPVTVPATRPGAAAPPLDSATVAAPAEVDASAPRKRAASGVLGFLKRRGRGRVADGE